MVRLIVIPAKAGIQDPQSYAVALAPPLSRG